MVFTSIPAPYLDAANWHQHQHQHQQQQEQQQQPNHQLGNSTSSHSQQLLPPPPLPSPPPPQHHGAGGSGGAGSIRPGSMVDRARMANLPMPEAALKCPRCESTNTKFCYFNNYSLSQPRHFCKTCRRYWTRGGALRNVPVGGGCRRTHKRSKGAGGSSKSPASSADRQTGSASSTNSVSSNGAAAAAAADHMVGLSPHLPPLRFMAPLHHHHQLTDSGAGDPMSLNYGLNYGAISGGGDLSFQIGNAFGGGGGGGSSILSGGALEQWRLPQQQFPFLGGLELGSQGGGGGSGNGNGGGGLYPFEGDGRVCVSTTSGIMTQLASVKMEDSNRELSFLLGSSSNNNNNNVHQQQQYWMTAGTTSNWTHHLSSSTATTDNNQL